MAEGAEVRVKSRRVGDNEVTAGGLPCRNWRGLWGWGRGCGLRKMKMKTFLTRKWRRVDAESRFHMTEKVDRGRAPGVREEELYARVSWRNGG